MNAVALISNRKSLDEIAEEINALADKVADHRLQQAVLLRQADQRIRDETDGKDERRAAWREWGATLTIGKHEVNKLLRIGCSSDPAGALAAQREKDRLAGQKHRKQQDLHKSRSPDLALKGFRQRLPRDLPAKDREKLATKTLRALGYRTPENLVADLWHMDVDAARSRLRMQEIDPIKAVKNMLLRRSKAEREVFIRQLMADFVIADEVPVDVEVEKEVIDCPF